MGSNGGLDEHADNVVVAYDSGSKKLVLVYANHDRYETVVSFDLSAFGVIGGPVTRWSTNTDPDGERYVSYTDVTVDDANVLTLRLPRHTIVTFEVEDVEMLAGSTA